MFCGYSTVNLLGSASYWKILVIKKTTNAANNCELAGVYCDRFVSKMLQNRAAAGQFSTNYNITLLLL